jgi:hypothetical protein
MKKKGIAIMAGGIVALALAPATGGTASAAASIPLPPHGYREYYYHNFSTGGLSGWKVQQGSTAPVSVDALGLAVTVTGPDQVTEVVSDGTMVIPGSFIQARVYLPAVKGRIANFPALWTVSTVPSEIDMVEGLAGLACSHTHYLRANTSESLCAPAGSQTGWHVFSALWRNGKVAFWYDSTLEGTLPLPVTAHHRLIFQNRSRSSYCPSCYGPAVYPSASRLTWIKVWHSSRADTTFANSTLTCSTARHGTAAFL